MIDGGKHLPVYFGDLHMALLDAMRRFVYDLDAKCAVNAKCEQRLRNILQIYPM